MSDEGVIFYAGSANENANDWEDNDDLQALMHAAADADARDNQVALIQNEEVAEEQASTSSPTQNEIIKENKQKSKSEKPVEKKQTYTDYFNNSKEPPQQRSGLKRKLEETERPAKRLGTEDGTPYTRPEGHANVVAAHYNTLEDKGLDERLKSRIFYMRNFNNWIKSMLINEYLNKAKIGMKHNSPVRVMDMCCGKGGDLLKWRKGNISYLICTDIASVSLEQCESRYNEMCSRSHRERNAGRIYRAEFIPADSTKVRLREKYADPSVKLDLVSCQFAFHYSFESLPQAECMLRNAAECLQPGGYFIGTMPDANEILARLRKANANTFGNDVFQITFDTDTKTAPLFGGKYNFHLEGVVDCPEFLVHFKTFVKLAKKFGLQLVNVESFIDFYERMKSEGAGLLQKMQCLETYPPYDKTALMGTDPNDYKHALEYAEKKTIASDQNIGTLSKSEWEAVSLYLTFAFRKAKTTWDSKGNPQYEFS